MTSYIFDNDRAGAMFVDALARAVQRGRDGARAHRRAWERATAGLPSPACSPRAGIPHARFLPHRLPARQPVSSTCAVTGRSWWWTGGSGFTGGMNIARGSLPGRAVEGARPRTSHCARHRAGGGGSCRRRSPRTGPSPRRRCSRERRGSRPWSRPGRWWRGAFPTAPTRTSRRCTIRSSARCRCAHHSVQIVTPYFLPDEPLIDALSVASMRGRAGGPRAAREEQPHGGAWAATAGLWQVLKWGCRVYFSPRRPSTTPRSWWWMAPGRCSARPTGIRAACGSTSSTTSSATTTALARELTDIIQRKIATARLYAPTEWQRQSLFQRLRGWRGKAGTAIRL